MSRMIIDGLPKLTGELKIQGSKNSVLPILAASLICSGESVLHNCPVLSDVNASVKILRYLGASVKREGDTLITDSSSLTGFTIPDELMREMRSSVIFLGALLSREGKAKISLPGGCDIGTRPIDLHLKALRQMGVHISEHGGSITCDAPKGLKGTKIALGFPSVGATENIILAAVKAKGTTIITNAATEPEIGDLCDYLNKCGAKIMTGESGSIIIDGTDHLHGAMHAVIPDRIVAATYMSAAAVTGSSILLKDVIPMHLSSVIPVFEESGCKIIQKGMSLSITAPQRLKSFRLIRTMPYPGFPTDAQPLVLASAALADGTSVFVENIFENRYKHVSELTRLGADISVEGKVCVVQGVKRLYATKVKAQDLRGAAALIVAGLASEGTTIVEGIEYLERGYEDFDVSLNRLGANIKKL